MWLTYMVKIPQNGKKFRKYILLKRYSTEQFWFVTVRTTGCVPLLRDHLPCKTTFLWQKGWSQMTGFTVKLYTYMSAFSYDCTMKV